MKMDLGKMIAVIIWSSFRWLILHTPDKGMVLIVRGARWLLWVITGDRQLRSMVTEVLGIFEDGPPDTDIVRRLFREADPDFTIDLVRGGLRL